MFGHTYADFIIKNFFIQFLQLAKKGARCDYGIYMGASATNFEEIVELASHVVGLKMYLNETFTTLKLDGIQQWLKVCNL